jgi:predicted ATPase/class 3 adenylate cyclase
VATLPTGTVTFLFTDIEGSTRLLHELGAERYAAALAEHRRAIREACTARGGVEVDTQGDAFFFAFARAPDAVAAAREVTRSLAPGPIRVRIGLHTGTPLVTDEGYIGGDVPYAARIASASHGGQVVLSAATGGLLDDTFPVTSLGEHRIKDIDRPVLIFQLGDEAFPPLRTLSNTNLPRPASSFVGRERECDEIVARVAGGVRLLSLTGPGGSGKTRLAIEAASMLVSDFGSGVYWVGLADLRDTALVIPAIAETLGARNGVAQHIGERHLLLLVDNLEHVIQAARELADLVERCPNLVVLATSRELLRVRGEIEYAVPPLAEADGAVLFCERAQATMTDEIGELCRRLDSLPLAVELAAARARALSPGQMLARLSQRLELLKGGRDADPRQQTLRATLEWSHDLLSEGEQQLFARLSIFAGGCALEAAEQIAGADLDTLQSLVEKNLLRFTDVRYWMLETIREYAAEKGEMLPGLEELRSRHSDYFAAAAEAQHREWMYGTDVRSPYRWFRAERENLRRAVEWSSSRAEQHLRLLHDVRAHGVFSSGELRDLLESAIVRSADRPAIVRARALLGLAEACSDEGDFDSALLHNEQAVALYRSVRDEEGIARSLVGRGWAFEQLGRPGEARDAFEQALRAARRAPSPPVVIGASTSLALLSLKQGEYEEALRFAATAMAEDPTHSGIARRVPGLVALKRGEVAEGKRLLAESLAFHYELGYEPALPNSLDAMAAALAAGADVERATVLTGQSEALRDSLALEPEPYVRELRASLVEAGRAALGEEGFRAATARGAAMSIDEAVKYALAASGIRAG